MFPLAIVLLIMVVVSLFLMIATMDSGFENGPAFWLGIFVATIIIVFVSLSIDPYRDGQIDALSGNIKYELRKTSDGEMKWEEIHKQSHKDTVVVRDTVYIPIK